MRRTVSIAACQFLIRPITSFDEFAAHVRQLLDQAVGAHLVVFPELFTLELLTTFGDWKRAPLSEAVRVEEYTQAYRDLFAGEAQDRGQYIVAGSHLTRCGKVYLNLAYLFGPQGLIQTHAKTHIFPAEQYWTSTEEGSSLQVIDLPFAKVGFNICSEAEIPECASSLTEQGVEVILCPSYTFDEYGYWRVRNCAQARCIENQVYFVHCCTGGALPTDQAIPNGWARSSILSPCDLPWQPDGVISQGEANKEMVICGEVDIDMMHRNRVSGAAPTYRVRRRRADLHVNWPSHIKSLRA